MHELAFTRSEPEAKTNATQPKPDALEVQYHVAWGHRQSRSEVPSLESHTFEKCLGESVICHLEWRLYGSTLM